MSLNSPAAVIVVVGVVVPPAGVVVPPIALTPIVTLFLDVLSHAVDGQRAQSPEQFVAIGDGAKPVLAGEIIVQVRRKVGHGRDGIVIVRVVVDDPRVIVVIVHGRYLVTDPLVVVIRAGKTRGETK
ncbi:MAG: hypothetical protein M5R36_04310 [Deltaproteobacteria bacterium]|nr:hypothetical protein [Deltaproteobacteria bacterium]